MKIKYHGYCTFRIIGKRVSIITDPVSLFEQGGSMSKTKADICLISDPEYIGKSDVLKKADIENKIEVRRKKKGPGKVFVIVNPGEYEFGGLLIRRQTEDGVYFIDDGSIRVLYLGGLTADFDIKKLKDLGDVDVLIVPVGDGDRFASLQKVEKIVSMTDPAFVLPCGYKDKDLKGTSELKTIEDFMKEVGFSESHETEKSLKVTKSTVDDDQKDLAVVVLQKLK
ncbi:hypothetical protein GF357_04310 [Candidatus Dojkabacteria bacterium]|nr:hypothetical protein [Candidatus Dojkabacteria bacterium]